MFPDVTRSRRPPRSTASCRPAPPTSLRERVVADPALIGQTVKVPVLLSDDADLYYKGIGTRDRSARRPRHRDAERHRPAKSRSCDLGNDFARELSTSSRRCRRRRAPCARTPTACARSSRTLDAAQGRARSARSRGARQRTGPNRDAREQHRDAQDRAAALSQQVKELDDEAAALQARFDSAGSDEPLDDQLPSLLVAINGGLVKVTELGNARRHGQRAAPAQVDRRGRARQLADRDLRDAGSRTAASATAR